MNNVRAYTDTIALPIRPWGPDSPLPNLARDGFRATYPYNLRDAFSYERTTRRFDSYVMENEYLRATVVPELGVRLAYLEDKVSGEQVFLSPEGVFPSPIDLRGAYFPLGIEFNFPCGHSVHAAEYIPTRLADNGDGSHSIVMRVYSAVSGIDTEISLSMYPGRRCIHQVTRFSNTLPVRNGFMYWANAAVPQTPQARFQCKASMSHFFVDYNTFPYIDGRDLRKVCERDYASDLFAIDSPEQWFGFYIPERQYGAVHISPKEHMLGKKLFSWGYDEYGARWGRHYGCTQSESYVECQAGILETQLEFTHLEPFESRVVCESWQPYNALGDISHASGDVVLSHEADALCMQSITVREQLTVQVRCGEHEADTDVGQLVPGDVARLNIPAGYDPDRYHIRIADGRDVLVDREITAVEPAGPEKIAAKQVELDLPGDDTASRMERAFRAYKARHFTSAKTIAQDLLGGSHDADARRLLAEIARVTHDSDPAQPVQAAVRSCTPAQAHDHERNRFTVKRLHRTLVEVTGNSETSWATQIDMPVRFDHLHETAHGQLHDRYARMAEADALAGEGKYGEVPALLSADAGLCPDAAYVCAYVWDRLGEQQQACAFRDKAASLDADYANPFTVLARESLEHAIGHCPTDARAHALLGLWWFRWDIRKAEAFWTRAVELDERDYLSRRNLAYVTMGRREELDKVVQLYKQAVALRSDIVNLWYEYCTAVRLSNDAPGAVAIIESLPDELRSDYRIVKLHASLLRDSERFAEALDVLAGCPCVYVWEGECGHHRCYLECHQALGVAALGKGRLDEAREHFNALTEYPENLVHGRPKVENRSIVHYHYALLAEAEGNTEQAQQCYRQAVDQPYPHIHHWISYRENEYYSALAAHKLGDHQQVATIARRLLERYTHSSTPNVHTSPVASEGYVTYLAAARGLALTGRYDEAMEALDHSDHLFGSCWPVRAAREQLLADKHPV